MLLQVITSRWSDLSTCLSRRSATQDTSAGPVHSNLYHREVTFCAKSIEENVEENGAKRGKKRIHVNFDKSIHERMGSVVPEITGKIRGAIEDAVNEALEFWLMKAEDKLDLKREAHAVWSLNYHFVFVPKYRKKVLTGRVKSRLEELVREQCEKNGFEIISLEIMPDHVHLFVSAPPRFALCEVAF